MMLTTRPQTLTALSVVLPLSLLKRQKTKEQGFNLSVAGGYTLGSLSNDDGDGNENAKKKNNNRFRLAKQHAFLYISLPSLNDYNVKVPNFTFCREREHKTQLPRNLPIFDELNEMK